MCYLQFYNKIKVEFKVDFSNINLKNRNDKKKYEPIKSSF